MGFVIVVFSGGVDFIYFLVEVVLVLKDCCVVLMVVLGIFLEAEYDDVRVLVFEFGVCYLFVDFNELEIDGY